MKSSYAALAVFGLAFAGLWYTGETSSLVPQPTAAAAQPRISAPVSHANLTVYFIHGPDEVSGVKVATLQEALEAGWAVVHETGEVNTLAIENRSPDCELFIQEGDIVQGGRQDRAIAMDMLVPPNSGRVPFPAHCVEQGRWVGRGNEAATHFNKSNNLVVGNELRLANANRDQGKVWDNVKIQQDKLSENLKVKVNAEESATSFQLALENPVVQATMGEFEQTLRASGEADANVIGVVFVLNGKVRTFEMYGSNVLFRKAWPKLLRSAAADAVAEKTDRQAPAAPNAREVERFVAITLAGQPESAAGPLSGIPDGPANALQSLTGRAPPWTIGYRVDVNPQAPIPPQPPQRILPVAGMGPPGTIINTEELQQSGQTPANADVNPRGGGWANVGREVNDNRASGNRGPAPAVAASPDGNRLTVNRVEDRSGLVSESRDAGRQNAVIHRSFIKK